MLPRKNRIPKEDFPTSKRQGLRLFSPFFSGTFYKEEGKTRVSVVVSKKTAKTAVARNLIRRRFYEIMQELQKSLTQQGMIVFYPKKETTTADFKDLKEEVKVALQKAKILV